MQYSRNDVQHYGDNEIQNINLLNGKRLKIEVIVFYAYCNGIKEYLDLYPKIKNKCNHKILDSIEDISVINENEIEIVVNYKNKYLIRIKCLFPKEYPFRPPQIKLNDKEYIHFISKVQNIKLNDDVKCLCCISLCCRENWGPQNIFIDVIEEIYKNLDTIYNPIEIKLYESLMDKYLGYNITHERL